MYSGANAGRIGLAQILENVAQQAIALGDDTPVEIPHREPVRRRVQIRMHRTRRAQRIEIGDQVAANTISVDQVSNRGFFVGIADGERRERTGTAARRREGSFRQLDRTDTTSRVR